ncbi:MAG TPA: ABC transporter permease [Gaiellales bacterium]|jgi:peptide/nickel transport system permease protein
MSAVATAVRSVTVRGNRRTRAGAAILATLILIALLAPVLAPHDPNAIDPGRILAGPDLSHPFGSDALGRDVFSRVLFAYRVSLAVAIGSVLLALVVGVPLGLIAGYFGGPVDSLLMRPVDLLLALPALLLALSLISVIGPGTWVALFAIAVIYLPIMARVVRSSVLRVVNEDYVAGAGARGVSRMGIMVRHVLPNSLGPSLVQASVLMGFAIQIEAALSFLGLGAQPPTPSLGLMLADGYQVLQQAPWADIFPGLAIAIAVLAFILIGDGTRAHFDPHGVSR